MRWVTVGTAVALAVMCVVGSAGLGVAGCRNEQAAEAAQQHFTAEAMGTATCAACGMVVSEQPAPRGQAVHRDGTREFFCSLADMVQYAEIPSPHGALTHTFVEVLDAAADPLETDDAPRTWVEAETAAYVLGVQRKMIMGVPVLAYADAAQATKVAEPRGATVHTWAELRRRVMEWSHDNSARR
ncbi:MAG: nitrous oxide reductase accessory protein NosL [Myxococcota bacterium]